MSGASTVMGSTVLRNRNILDIATSVIPEASNKGLYVMLHGKEWAVTSETFDKNGNVVVTLMLRRPEGESAYADKLGSIHSSEPSNSYSHSLMRREIISPTGTFSKFSSGTFADSYLVQPKDISYQAIQNITWLALDEDFQYALPGEAVTDIGNSSYHQPSLNYANRWGGSDDWGNDRIWLPSVAELGLNDFNNFNIWGFRNDLANQGLSENFKAALRSGEGTPTGEYGGIYQYESDGVKYPIDQVKYYTGIRPAIHLNLTAASQNAAKTPITKPTCDVPDYGFNGKHRDLPVVNPDSTKITQGGDSPRQIHAGDYTTTYSLKDKANTCWADGTTDDVEIKWKIAKASSTKPSIKGKYEYNKLEQEVQFDGVYHPWTTETGTMKATDAGTYKVSIAIREGNKNDFYWEGTDPSESAKPYELEWTITPAMVIKPTAENLAFTFDGSAQTLAVTNPDADHMTISGDAFEQTNADAYSATFALKDKKNYNWDNKGALGGSEDVIIEWAIAKLLLTKPTIKGDSTYIFNGKEQTLALNDYNSTRLTIEDNKATNVGEHSAIISIIDKENVAWKDNTNADILLAWKIATLLLTKPTATNLKMTYNGQLQTLAVMNPDSSWITNSGDTFAKTYAGDYATTFKLNDKNNTAWKEDLTNIDVVIKWKINKAQLGAVWNLDSEIPKLIFDDLPTNAVTYKFLDQGNVEVSVGDLMPDREYTITAALMVEYAKNYGFGVSLASSMSTTFTMNKVELAKPTISGADSLEFNNQSQGFIINGLNNEFMSVSGDELTQTNAGEYSVTISLKDGAIWADGSSEDVILIFKITKLKLDKPFKSGATYAYNGAEQKLAVQGVDEAWMTASGDIAAMVAGDYEAVYSLIDTANTEWTLGGADEVTIRWSIAKAQLDADWNTDDKTPKLNLDDLPGDAVSYMYQDAEGNTVVLEELLKDVEYSVIATLSADFAKNYGFGAGLSNSVSTRFTIPSVKLAMPAMSGANSVDYNGQAQKFVLDNWNEKYMSVSGDSLTQTNAGEYSVTISLKNGAIWADGSSDDITIKWSIAKANVKAEWDTSGGVPTIKDLPDALKDAVVYTYRDGDGNVVAKEDMVEGKDYIVEAALSPEYADNYGFGATMSTNVSSEKFEFGKAIGGDKGGIPMWQAVVSGIGYSLGLIFLIIALVGFIKARKYNKENKERFDSKGGQMFAALPMLGAAGGDTLWGIGSGGWTAVAAVAIVFCVVSLIVMLIAGKRRAVAWQKLDNAKKLNKVMKEKQDEIEWVERKQRDKELKMKKIIAEVKNSSKADKLAKNAENQVNADILEKLVDRQLDVMNRQTKIIDTLTDRDGDKANGGKADGEASSDTEEGG